jgi:hypothetical protein
MRNELLQLVAECWSHQMLAPETLSHFFFDAMLLSFQENLLALHR